MENPTLKWVFGLLLLKASNFKFSLKKSRGLVVQHSLLQRFLVLGSTSPLLLTSLTKVEQKLIKIADVYLSLNFKWVVFYSYHFSIFLSIAVRGEVYY